MQYRYLLAAVRGICTVCNALEVSASGHRVLLHIRKLDFKSAFIVWKLHLFSYSSDMHLTVNGIIVQQGNRPEMSCFKIKMKKSLTIYWVLSYARAQLWFSNCIGIDSRRDPLILARIRDHTSTKCSIFCKGKWQGKIRKAQVSCYSNRESCLWAPLLYQPVGKNSKPALPKSLFKDNIIDAVKHTKAVCRCPERALS